jgi:hypothetical protein
MLTVIGVLALAWALVFLGISRFRLGIDAKSISYSSLFTRKRTLERSEITHADFAEVTGAFESPITFLIRTKAGEEMRINAKVFSIEAVRELCSLASESLRHQTNTMQAANSCPR